MKTIYCKECEEYVELKEGKCPKCKTDLEAKEIEKLQDFFFKIAPIGKILLFILAGTIGIYTLHAWEEGWFVTIGIVIFLILEGVLFEKNAKWKAYILKIKKEKRKK